MADPFAEYRDSTHTLILLMGENPLPNYVAARLLAGTHTRILLVYSEGTDKQCENLQKVLKTKGYSIKPDDRVQVEESNPANIYNKITESLEGCSGMVGLNYTGGTKAMSVHAYRVLEDLENADVTEKYYSYLDARRLSMWFTDDGNNTWSEDIGTRVPVNLNELLELHGLETLEEPKEEVRWPETTQVLLNIYSDPQQHDEWIKWYAKNNLNTNKGPRDSLSTDDFPQPIREALQRDNPTLNFPVLFRDLVQAGNFKPEERPNQKRTAAEVCGTWFTSTWLEEYVFRTVQEIQSEQHINDLKMSIEPVLGPDDNFEFDVAFMRGHQLFGISCSAMTKKKELKKKLLEVAVRASQLGGGETCFALVCCAEGDNLTNLKHQLDSLTNLDKRRIRVFGRNDLDSLQNRLKTWIKEASAS